jgi:hypothetical protein
MADYLHASEIVRASQDFDRLVDEQVQALSSELDGEPSIEQRLDARVDALQKWLEERWGEHNSCPHCSNVEWWVAREARFEDDFGSGSKILFQVTCRYCGYVAFVNPYLADLQTPGIPEDHQS